MGWLEKIVDFFFGWFKYLSPRGVLGIAGLVIVLGLSGIFSFNLSFKKLFGIKSKRRKSSDTGQEITTEGNGEEGVESVVAVPQPETESSPTPNNG